MTASTARRRSGRSASSGTRYGIPASRILPLARTSRWAMVGSGTRKARAISVVVSPPRSRSVSATWTPVASAGWQQVKIRRSRSSRTGLTSAGSSPSWSRAAWACRSSRDASRRRRSIARLRAVVMIHPAGLGGSPVDGHRRTATVNASWTASSATSMSRKRLTRTATARPYSSRNTRSISEAARAGTRGSVLGLVLERPHLDRQRDRPGGLTAPFERGVEVGRPDDHEAAAVLLALGVRAVGREHLALLEPHDGGRARGVQAPVEDPRARGLDLPDQGVDVPHHLLEIHGGWGRSVGLVDAEQVLLHRVSLLTLPPAPCRLLTFDTNGIRPDRQWTCHGNSAPQPVFPAAGSAGRQVAITRPV